MVPITTLSTVQGQGFQTNSSSTTLSLCSRHYCSYYIRPRPHETGTDRQRSDYVAAPLFLNGLSVGLTERSLSPTYDTHVALGLGTPTHPLAANCHSYLQHEGIPIFPYTKTEHTTHATTPTCALAHSRAHTATHGRSACAVVVRRKTDPRARVTAGFLLHHSRHQVNETAWSWITELMG